jgi:hypothetical protein
MKIIYYIFLLTLFSCSINGKHVPETVKTQIGNYADTAFICFDGIQKDIIWYNEITENADTIIYRFDIPCQLSEDNENRIMPMEYKAIVVNDSLVDVLQYWNLFNTWISEFPEPFIYKDLKYWKDITNFEMINSIQSDKLEVIEDDYLGWIENYSGNVKVEMKNEILFCDSLRWSPNCESININSKCKLVRCDELGDTVSIIIGQGMSIDVEEENYRIFEIVGITNF